MDGVELKSLTAACGMLALASCCRETTRHDGIQGEMPPPAHPKEMARGEGPPAAHAQGMPEVNESNRIACDYPDTEMRPSPTRAYILHIPKDILSSLASKASVCGANKTCVQTATALPNAPNGDEDDPDQDNDGVTGSPVPVKPVKLVKWSSINWRTPLDVDLDPPGGPSHWVKGHPILLQIVLDNTSFRFLHDQTSTDTARSDYAVMQGFEGSGMFRCLGAPKQSNGLWSVTLRVFSSTEPDASGKKYGGNSRWGGLSIGILVPTGVAGIYMPMFIDPQIHNSG